MKGISLKRTDYQKKVFLQYQSLKWGKRWVKQLPAKACFLDETHSYQKETAQQWRLLQIDEACRWKPPVCFVCFPILIDALSSKACFTALSSFLLSWAQWKKGIVFTAALQVSVLLSTQSCDKQSHRAGCRNKRADWAVLFSYLVLQRYKSSSGSHSFFFVCKAQHQFATAYRERGSASI